MRTRLILTTFLSLVCGTSAIHAEYSDHRRKNLDSLENVVVKYTPDRIEKASEEEIKDLIGAYDNLMNGYLQINRERSILFARKQIALASRMGWLVKKSDAEKTIGNILGYLFAKSVEMTVNEAKENPTFKTRLTASYSPHDALQGILRSTLSPEQHATLEDAMELALQFGKDIFVFMEMTDKTDDDFPELFTQAAIVVQKIGQMYASNGFEEACRIRP